MKHKQDVLNNKTKQQRVRLGEIQDYPGLNKSGCLTSLPYRVNTLPSASVLSGHRGSWLPLLLFFLSTVSAAQSCWLFPLYTTFLPGFTLRN